MTTRQFLQTAADSRNAAREVLQTVFMAELLKPSRCIWIVSPWLRDIPVLDNAARGFSALAVQFPTTELRLSRVLVELMTRGTEVVVATRPDPGNRQLPDAVVAAGGLKMKFIERADLHAKGVIGDRYAITGSMNLTFNGIDYLNEMLQFTTEIAQVERLRLAFRGEYGGAA